MGKVLNMRRLLLRRVAVATGAGLLAVVAGLGMAPAGADDDVSVEAEGSVEVQSPTDINTGLLIFNRKDSRLAEAEAEAGVEAPLFIPPDGPDKAADDFSAEAEAEASVIDRPVLIVGYEISG